MSEFEFILEPFHNTMNPTVRPDYSSNTLRDEVRELNQLLLAQIEEMKWRIGRLEQFIENDKTFTS